MLVDREQLEAAIERVRSEVPEPRAGLYGPGSVSWRVNRESILFLAGGRAALLQLAHPFVAHAIDRHSATRTDPLGRFQRTFEHVFAMVFGDLEHAVSSARRVHAIHARISGSIDESVGPFAAGSRYQANDAEALFWVHATLVDSAVLAFERVMGPLTPGDKQTYYDESRRFARLFGIPDAVMPDGWRAFEAYNRRMHRWLAVAPAAREMAGYLLSPPALSPPWLARWYRLMTTGLLPEELREPFGLPFGGAARLAFDATMRSLGPTYRAIPQRLRCMPAYLDARRRIAGKPGRDPLGRLFERYVLQAALRTSE